MEGFTIEKINYSRRGFRAEKRQEWKSGFLPKSSSGWPNHTFKPVFSDRLILLDPANSSLSHWKPKWATAMIGLEKASLKAKTCKKAL